MRNSRTAAPRRRAGLYREVVAHESSSSAVDAATVAWGIPATLREGGAALGQTTQSGDPKGVLLAVLQIIQAQPGGIAGVLQKFEAGGLSSMVQSWLSGSVNQSITPAQVQSVLGDRAVGQVAQQLGVSHDQAAGYIAQFLPLVSDHLTPKGRAPAGGGLQEIGGLLSRSGETGS